MKLKENLKLAFLCNPSPLKSFAEKYESMAETTGDKEYYKLAATSLEKRYILMGKKRINWKIKRDNLWSQEDRQRRRNAEARIRNRHGYSMLKEDIGIFNLGGRLIDSDIIDRTQATIDRSNAKIDHLDDLINNLNENEPRYQDIRDIDRMCELLDHGGFYEKAIDKLFEYSPDYGYINYNLVRESAEKLKHYDKFRYLERAIKEFSSREDSRYLSHVCDLFEELLYEKKEERTTEAEKLAREMYEELARKLIYSGRGSYFGRKIYKIVCDNLAEKLYKIEISRNGIIGKDHKINKRVLSSIEKVGKIAEKRYINTIHASLEDPNLSRIAARAYHGLGYYWKQFGKLERAKKFYEKSMRTLAWVKEFGAFEIVGSTFYNLQKEMI